MFKVDQKIKLDGEAWTIEAIGAQTATETILNCFDHKDINRRRGMICWVNNSTLETRNANQ